MMNFEFVPAGLETLYPYLVKLLGQDVTNIVCNKIVKTGLLSFGGELTKGKDLPSCQKYLDKLYNSRLRHCKPFVDNGGHLFSDSGGYQVITGYVKKKDLNRFIDTYTKFLNDYKDYYTYAFSLDIPEFRGIASRDEIYRLNQVSHSIMDNLNNDVRERIYFVCHTSNSEVYRIWNRLIFEDGILNKFKKFSIGGLVSSRPSTKLMRYTLMIVGLLQIIVGLDYKLPDPFYFHILGSTIPRNILFYALLKKHIESLFGVKCIITYDSSVVFKKVMISRSFTYYDKNTIEAHNVSVKSTELDDIHPVIRKSNKEIFMDCIHEMISYLGFQDEYKLDKIYDGDTICEKIRPWMLLIECYTLKKFSDDSLKLAEELYKSYNPCCDNLEFNEAIHSYFIGLNQNKYSNICRDFCNSVISSLDCLYEFVVDKKGPEQLESFLNSFDTVLDVTINDHTKGLELPF